MIEKFASAGGQGVTQVLDLNHTNNF